MQFVSRFRHREDREFLLAQLDAAVLDDLRFGSDAELLDLVASGAEDCVSVAEFRELVAWNDVKAGAHRGAPVQGR